MSIKNTFEKMCQYFDEKYDGENKALLLDAINDFCNEEDIDFHYEYDENVRTDFMGIEDMDESDETTEDED